MDILRSTQLPTQLRISNEATPQRFPHADHTGCSGCQRQRLVRVDYDVRLASWMENTNAALASRRGGSLPDLFLRQLTAAYRIGIGRREILSRFQQAASQSSTVRGYLATRQHTYSIFRWGWISSWSVSPCGFCVSNGFPPVPH